VYYNYDEAIFVHGVVCKCGLEVELAGFLCLSPSAPAHMALICAVIHIYDYKFRFSVYLLFFRGCREVAGRLEM